MYHVASLPGTSMPATFHSCFSVLCVPELSPRLTKGIFFSAKVFRAVGMSFPLTPAGSAAGPISTKSLYIT